MMHAQPFTKHARTDERKNNKPIGSERNLIYKSEQSKAIVQKKMKSCFWASCPCLSNHPVSGYLYIRALHPLSLYASNALQSQMGFNAILEVGVTVHYKWALLCLIHMIVLQSCVSLVKLLSCVPNAFKSCYRYTPLNHVINNMIT